MATATRKKTVAKRTTAKRNIASKKSAAKKTTAVKRSTRTAKAENGNGASAAKKIAERYSEQSAQVKDLHAKYDGDWSKISKAGDMSVGKAQRMFAIASLKPSDRIVTAGRDDKDVAKDVVRLRDDEGLSFMPDIWARTGLSPKRIAQLYKLGGGKGRVPTETAGNGNGNGTKSTAKRTTKKTTAKRTTRKAGGRSKSRSGSAQS